MGRYDEILARFMRKDRPADAYTTQWVQNAFEN